MPGQRVVWLRKLRRGGAVKAPRRTDAEVVKVGEKRVLILYKMKVLYVSETRDEDDFAWVRPENLEVLPVDG